MNKERRWHTLKQLMRDITVLEIEEPGELQDFTRPLMSAGSRVSRGSWELSGVGTRCQRQTQR